MYTGLIKTEQQYTAALSRLEALMGAAAGTPEADELELLALLIGTYEDQRYPQELPTPAEAIRFRMEQLGLRQKDLIPYLGSASRVSEVLNGKRELTISMMRALHEGLGIPADVLLRQRGGRLPDDAEGLDWQRFPVRELATRGWLPGGVSRVKEHAEEIMREYLRPLREAGLTQVMCRASAPGKAPAEVDYALLAWTARIVAVAAGVATPSYRPGSIDASFLSHLVQLSSYDEGPLLAKQFLHRNGVRLVVEPHLRGTRLDGAAIMTADGVPIIGMTLRYDRVDHFWFTLLHELGHVARHLHGAGEIVDQEIGQRTTGKDLREQEADLFAENAIAETQVLRDAGLLDAPTAAGVVVLATALRVHPALVAGRVRKECGNYRLLSEVANAKGVRAVCGLET